MENETKYFMGEKVRMTGKIEEIHGGLFREFVYLTGPKKGQTGHIADRHFN